jgi:hypothetical protein
MSTPQNPTPEADDTLTPGDEIPSSSPSARESASKCRERTGACSGDTLTPGAVTAASSDVTESPEGGAEPDRPAAQQAAPSHPPGHRRANAASPAQVDAMPRWLRRQIEQGLPRIAEAYVPLPKADFVPSILRRPENADLLRQAGMVVTPPVTPPQSDQPSGFVPRELREEGWAVTPPVTPSQAPPVATSVTPAVTAPAVGSMCPTCNCRVPARLNSADRQRAYRARQREQGKLVP